MSQTINTNVFPKTTNGIVYGEKFVDFDGLSYFWSKAKSYVDAVDEVLAGKISTLENTVGDETKGLVQKVNLIQGELDGLNGGAGSITTQISNAIAALDLPNTYEAKGAAADALESANGYTDGKVSGLKSDLEGQLSDGVAAAKKYTDDELAGKLGVYASEGVEASGLRKEIADRDAQVLADAKSYADGLDAAMNARVVKLEAIDHDKLAADAASSAVATVVGGAPEAFDTLKEIADWIGAGDANGDAAALVTRVAALEAEDTKIREDFASADAQVLADAKKYADDKDAVLAETVAKNLADAIGVKASEGVEATGLRAEIDAAKAAAIADAEGKVATVNGRVDTLAQTVADNLAAAKTYADGKASEAESNAKGYVDSTIANYTNTKSMQAAIDAAKAAAIADAQAKVEALAAQVATKAEITYVDEQVAAAKTYAKTYTDALFNSIEFVSEYDIDQMFTVSE